MSCCTAKSEFPDPYAFNFVGRGHLEDNRVAFPSNYVRTSKYTIWTFFPISLMAQFYRVANVYFLFIAILQTVPIISDLGSGTAWAPLIVVILISMARQGYEDYVRYQSDKVLNFEMRARVRRGDKFEDVNWGEVLVGDICLVEEGETFPADLLILSSAIEGGNAYIQTAGLDGQKNLKPRLALKETNHVRDDAALNNFQGQIVCAVPNKSLHDFQATLNIKGVNKKLLYEGEKQFLYRGAKLKNTKWVYGLVVYTGKVTKIMMNSESSASKMSQIELRVNRLLVVIFMFQIVLCLVCSITYSVVRTNNQMWYLDPPAPNTNTQSLIMFFSYLVLLNTMIPISLIVSLEIVKTIQGKFIQNDMLFWDNKKQKGATVFSSTLNQELGQIEYIFSDKTGTLTCNIMQFKIAVIGEQMYGDRSLITDQPQKSPPEDLREEPVEELKGFFDSELANVLKGKCKNNLKQAVDLNGQGKSIKIQGIQKLAQEYMMILCLAHECVVQKDKTGNISYQGPSPDQITLVQAAKNMGYVYKRSDNQFSYIEIKSKEHRVEVLGVYPFTSDRKRMSVMVKYDGVIKLLVKGADNIIKKRLSSKQPYYVQSIQEYLRLFSLKGLRTLLVAERIVSQEQYQKFHQKEQSLPEQGRVKAKDQLVDQLEKGFVLIGATAVLDRLQDKVPETIKDLIRADIKIWMLTGDKLETAENIAMSCNLIQQSFNTIKYLPQGDDLDAELVRCLQKARSCVKSNVKKAFLIEGEHLGKLMESEENKLLIVELAKICESVICCRLLPLQKADVVKLVKEKLQKITLAIGDGANDVPMIKMAHIGVGLFGEEGMGAVQASDYALPEFKGLWRLLLVHGRWSYLRNSQMILYFFYKNMIFTIPQFYYAFYCGFSGQSIFDSLYITLYNVVFTAVPLVVRAVLQQDVYYIFKDKYDRPERRSLGAELPDDYIVRKTLQRLHPKIYYIGQKNTIFNYTNFFFWVSEALLQGLLIFLICIYSLGSDAMNQTGINSTQATVNIACFSSIIVLVTFKIAAHTKFWSWFNVMGVLVLSLCLYVGFMWLSNIKSLSTTVAGTIIPIESSLKVYLVVLFCTCVLLMVDGLVLFIRQLTGGKYSKMKTVIHEDKMSDNSFYEQISLRMTEVTKKTFRG